ncbi:MAG: spore maturation protein [Clostridiales bacterium]|nr:spore maturation protein [Clostridiales bacterium]
MSVYILPVLIIFLFIYSFFKKVNVYKSFVGGAKGAFALCLDIFPYICAILCAVALFRASGLALWLTQILSPVFSFLGIPPEVSELVFLRPFTGSGSFALLNNIFATYGADSYIARCASCILSSSETLFYVTTVYTSKTSIKKLGYAIPVGLLASIFGAVVSCLFCRII